MALIGTLILFPLAIAGMLLIARHDTVRTVLVLVAACVIGFLSFAFAIFFVGQPLVLIPLSSGLIDGCAIVITLILAGVILGFSLKYHNLWAALLALIQIAGSLVFDVMIARGIGVSEGLYVDTLTVIMVLIIGIIGSGICVYSLGYMRDFQAQEPADAKDRRPTFFALMFLFLAAMFAIVFSNNMVWLFCGWEITTVCSFLLIAYTRTDEAIRNAFRQVIMNLIGGIAFLIGLYACVFNFNTLSLFSFLQMGTAEPALASLPVCAFALAGLTKAAQMPFHTWLLGAMVAPTPTSALLHSSTMVKAGVFLLIKLAPLFLVCPAPAVMVTLIGGVTFTLCSFMAISQTNAKRVLAYSTIANLGLICACAGVATPEAVWAGVFLIIFHATAKSLLFLCVGTAEHHIGSRDIEDMDLLFSRMPWLTRFAMVGILCMFIAPFGMLIAKWATLVSFVDSGQATLILLLAFGSAATFMFWAKWLGKLSGIAAERDNVELNVYKSEWIALFVMLACSLICTIGLPLLSGILVEPYVIDVFGTAGQSIATDNLWIASLLAVFVAAVIFGGLHRGQQRKASVYLSGVGTDSDNRTYRNSLGAETSATSRNLYLKGVFGEQHIRPAGEIFCSAVVVIAFVMSLNGFLFF